MIRNAFIAGVTTILIIAVATEIKFPPKPFVLYNPSASAPIGWYKIQSKDQTYRDDVVAAYAPDWARKLADERRYLPYDYPMIKTIWAVEGEQVCFEHNRVSVPNRPDILIQAQDSLGRDMPVMSGCSLLKAGEVLLISPDVQYAYDGRYFGQIPLKNILGKVHYLGNRKIDFLEDKREK